MRTIKISEETYSKIKDQLLQDEGKEIIVMIPLLSSLEYCRLY